MLIHFSPMPLFKAMSTFVNFFYTYNLLFFFCYSHFFHNLLPIALTVKKIIAPPYVCHYTVLRYGFYFLM